MIHGAFPASIGRRAERHSVAGRLRSKLYLLFGYIASTSLCINRSYIYSLMRGLEAASDEDSRSSGYSGRRNGAADRSRLYILKYNSQGVGWPSDRHIYIRTERAARRRHRLGDEPRAAPRVERLRITSIIYVLIKIPKI